MFLALENTIWWHYYLVKVLSISFLKDFVCHLVGKGILSKLKVLSKLSLKSQTFDFENLGFSILIYFWTFAGDSTKMCFNLQKVLYYLKVSEYIIFCGIGFRCEFRVLLWHTKWPTRAPKKVADFVNLVYIPNPLICTGEKICQEKSSNCNHYFLFILTLTVSEVIRDSFLVWVIF